MSRVAWVGLLCLTLVAGCDRHEAATQPHKPRPVVTAEVQRITEHEVGPFSGKIEARYKTSLGFRLGGRVIKRDVHVGDSVTAGAMLAELDPTQQRLQLAHADADVANGEAQVTNAIEEYNRKAQLLTTGDVPQAQVDVARASRDTAVSRLDAMRATQLKAREALGYASLHAEFDGVVTSWQTEVGQEVQAGQAVVEMVRPDVREAVVDVPVDIVHALPKDPIFAVTLDGDPTHPVEARLRETGPLADAQTRTQHLRLSLTATPDSFRLGSTILVSLQQSTAPHIALPAEAVFDDNGRTFVWTVEDGQRVERREIVVTGRDGTGVTATGDLPGKIPVVVAGVHSLHPGQRVRLVKDR